MQGQSEALYQVGLHILLANPELLLIPDDTHGQLGAEQHPVQLLPAFHQVLLQSDDLLTGSVLLVHPDHLLLVAPLYSGI